MGDFDSDKRRRRMQREASRKRRVRQTWVYKFERQERDRTESMMATLEQASRAASAATRVAKLGVIG